MNLKRHFGPGFQGASDGADLIDRALDDCEDPRHLVLGEPGQVELHVLLEQRVALLLAVGGAGHLDGRADSRRRGGVAAAASLAIPLQAASAIFISSPGVKTPSTSSLPTSTSAPRELRPVKRRTPVRSTHSSVMPYFYLVPK